MRIFALRNESTPAAVEQLQTIFHSTTSVLLRHEVAYVLGQMQLAEAEPFLISVLSDTSEHPVTRHEAAEALGAIGTLENVPLLRRFAEDAAPEVSQTCLLALHRIESNLDKGECACERTAQRALEGQGTDVVEVVPPSSTRGKPSTSGSAYVTVDPVHTGLRGMPVSRLSELLLDESKPLHERYEALFALRDLNTDTAAVVIAAGLRERSSALFRHEVAFVLGQMENAKTVDMLKQVLADVKEHGMVRHEAAEALGAIGSEDALSTLEHYAKDKEAIVRDSCIVALGMYDRDAFSNAGVEV